MTLEQYIDQALFGFKNDPADSDFQRGYEAALKEVRACVEKGIINSDDGNDDLKN